MFFVGEANAQKIFLPDSETNSTKNSELYTPEKLREYSLILEGVRKGTLPAKDLEKIINVLDEMRTGRPNIVRAEEVLQ